MSGNNLLTFHNVRKYFPIMKGIVVRKTIGYVKAVDGVSFSLGRGETLGLVGESGSGKSTIGRLVLRLLEPTSGRISFNGEDLSQLKGEKLKTFRRRVGVVFQDPFSSLDPRKNILNIVAEPLRVHGFEGNHEERVFELLEKVGLRPEDAYKHPHQFSGGQRQRIAIARALALSPDLVVADEPLSSLDVSVQAKIINLLQDLKRELGLSYLFISHDVSVVRQISEVICVLYLGKVMELGDVEEVLNLPLHPYTQALLASIPVPDPRVMRTRPPKPLYGEIPSPINPPQGCRFHPRCPYAKQVCRRTEPLLEKVGKNHYVACHLWRELETSR
jgi:oligopeptide/dipeptide ABC transporter ATP-binding protein